MSLALPKVEEDDDDDDDLPLTPRTTDLIKQNTSQRDLLEAVEEEFSLKQKEWVELREFLTSRIEDLKHLKIVGRFLIERVLDRRNEVLKKKFQLRHFFPWRKLVQRTVFRMEIERSHEACYTVTSKLLVQMCFHVLTMNRTTRGPIYVLLRVGPEPEDPREDVSLRPMRLRNLLKLWTLVAKMRAWTRRPDGTYPPDPDDEYEQPVRQAPKPKKPPTQKELDRMERERKRIARRKRHQEEQKTERHGGYLWMLLRHNNALKVLKNRRHAARKHLEGDITGWRWRYAELALWCWRAAARLLFRQREAERNEMALHTHEMRKVLCAKWHHVVDLCLARAHYMSTLEFNTIMLEDQRNQWEAHTQKLEAELASLMPSFGERALSPQQKIKLDAMQNIRLVAIPRAQPSSEADAFGASEIGPAPEPRMPRLTPVTLGRANHRRPASPRSEDTRQPPGPRTNAKAVVSGRDKDATRAGDTQQRPLKQGKERKLIFQSSDLPGWKSASAERQKRQAAVVSFDK